MAVAARQETEIESVERVSSQCTEVWSQNVCGSSCTHTAYVSSSESLYMSVGASSSVECKQAPSTFCGEGERGGTTMCAGTTAVVCGTTAVVCGTTAVVCGTTAVAHGTTAVVYGTTAVVCGTTAVGSTYMVQPRYR